MTLDEARKIYDECDEFIGEHSTAASITLDGMFSAKELMAIAIVMEATEAV